jgi:hypothetical protein
MREDYGPGTLDVAEGQIMVMRAAARERPAEALRVGEQALADLGTRAIATVEREQGLNAEREALTLEPQGLRAD